MEVKMEVFSGDPPCAACVDLIKLADVYAEKYEGKLKVIKLIGLDASDKFEKYELSCTPSIVINEHIKIEGVCPSYETLDNALLEGGL